MNNLRIFVPFMLFLAAVPIQALSEEVIDIPIAITALSGQQIEDRVREMTDTEHLRFHLNPGEDGQNIVYFGAGEGGLDSVFDLFNLQRVEVLRGPQGTLSNTQIILDGGNSGRRLAELNGQAYLGLRDVTIRNFRSNGHGGVVRLRGSSNLDAWRAQFIENSASGNGGVAQATDDSHIRLLESYTFRNSASNLGGAMSIELNATSHVTNSAFFDDDAASFGCVMNLSSSGKIRFDAGLLLEGSQFIGDCPRAGLEAPFGSALSLSGGYYFPDEAVHATDWVSWYNSYNGFADHYPNQLMAQANPGPVGGKPQALCEDFGTGAFMSWGYNLSEDNSCGFNQPTDISNTDGMTAIDGSGFHVPMPGSPLIESGPTDVQFFPGDTDAYLPCGFKDLRGYGRPQDSNNDGVFECDRGAIEVIFPASLTPGHSAAFFNVLRDGEGQYVEMLNENLAVVYTFTHRPDGSGSAWFIGVGYVLGNSIVIDQLLQPNGTSFGDDFDSAEIVTSVVGGQSMVFNDCDAGGMGGNVAFSGDIEQGYEALITRAQRLSNILGCGSITPHPNAGLSGSYFLPARDGEGIVVQWLPNGQVLVIFFTYDLNNNQQWVLGIGQSDGFSVTMDAVYASGNTTWGSDYDANDVVLSPWGTFELNWSECGGVQFGYNSTVNGYGSATREYIRLSSLWEASCPTF